MAPDQRERFTALDWIAVVVTASAILATSVTPLMVSRPFMEMFSEFGSVSELPALTRFSLSPWYGVLTPLPPLALLAWGIAGRGGIFQRRIVVVAAFVLALFVLGVYLCGAYAPILEIAEAIGP
jgi:hypothetical protein